MPLTAPRKISRIDRGFITAPVKAGVTCIQSGLAILASGYARPGREGQGADNAAKAADAATYQAVGVFAETVTGGAADGDKSVRVEPGIFNFKNATAGDQVTSADIGKVVFILDDQTVAKTNPNSTRAVAGPVNFVDAEGVWVEVGPLARRA